MGERESDERRERGKEREKEREDSARGGGGVRERERGGRADPDLDRHMGTQENMRTKDHRMGLRDFWLLECSKVGSSTMTRPTATTTAPMYCKDKDTGSNKGA